MGLSYAIKFVDDIDCVILFSPNFYAVGLGDGLVFTSPPTDGQGTRIARFRDLHAAQISVSGL